MSHTAELIAVGTELLLGNIANTNAQYLSRELSSLGINVFTRFLSCVNALVYLEITLSSKTLSTL